MIWATVRGNSTTSCRSTLPGEKHGLTLVSLVLREERSILVAFTSIEGKVCFS